MRDANPGPLPGDAVAGIFRQMMSACLALERRLRIAYSVRRAPSATARSAGISASSSMPSPAHRSTKSSAPPNPGRPTTRSCRSRTPPRARSDARWTSMCQTDADDRRRDSPAHPAESAGERYPARRGAQDLFALPIAVAVRAVAWRAICPLCRGFRWRATPKRHGWRRASPAPPQSPARPQPRSMRWTCSRRISRTIRTTRRASACWAGMRSPARATMKPRW